MSHGNRDRAARAVSRALRPRDGDSAAFLLTAVAHALNECERAGVGVKLAHGAVITESGYVFAVGPDGAPWAVRTRALTEFPVPSSDDD